MTRARTDAAQQEPAVPPTKPYPIGLRRRFQLRRRGRCDGRFAMPDPHSGITPLTTPARDQLGADHALQVARLWEAYGEERAALDSEIEGIDAQLVRFREAVEELARRLETARRSPPDRHNPQFTPGERRQRRSPEFVFLRRDRAYQQLIRELEGEYESASDDVAGAVRRRSALVGAAARCREAAVLTEHRLIATFECEQKIYDTALLRRHPQRVHVQPKLDRSLPELSPWAQTALNERGK